MQSRDQRQRDVLWAALIVLAVYAVVASTGCATYVVVTEAPVDFWLTVEAIVEALALDVWAIIEFLL